VTRTNRGAEGISGRVIFADFFQQDARKNLSAKIATPRFILLGFALLFSTYIFISPSEKVYCHSNA